MSLTENDLERMLSMNDEAFGRLILTIVHAAGGNEAKAKSLISDIPSLKKALAGLTPSEAEALLGKAGKRRSEDIYNAIRNSNG